MKMPEFLKKKKVKEDDFPSEISELPDDLERFRRDIEPPMPASRYPKPLDFSEEPIAKKVETQDKTDLILQKLETIDVRLKLLEEKLGV
jgi:hypothetical protein